MEVDASNRRGGAFAIDERDLGYFKNPCQRGVRGEEAVVRWGYFLMPPGYIEKVWDGRGVLGRTKVT